MKKKIIILNMIAVAAIAKADSAILFTDTLMANMTKGFISGIVTNMVLVNNTTDGNPAPSKTVTIYRGTGTSGQAQVLEDKSFRLDLNNFYSTYKVQSIDSFTVSVDSRYSIGNANVVFQKYDTNNVLVAEGTVTNILALAGSSWSTKSITFNAAAASFKADAGQSQMDFSNAPYYYTYAFVFTAGAGAASSSVLMDNFKMDVNYTAIPEPITASLVSLAGLVLIVLRRCTRA